MLNVLNVLLALGLIVSIMAAYYFGVVRLVVDPTSVLHRTRRHVRLSRRVRRECADLDREYASLVDEYRHIP